MTRDERFAQNQTIYGYPFDAQPGRGDVVHVIAPLSSGGCTYHELPITYDFTQQLPTGPYQGRVYRIFETVDDAEAFRQAQLTQP